MTLDRIAYESTIRAGQLASLEAAAQRACAEISPFTVTFSMLGGTPGATGFTAIPAWPVQDLRAALRAVTLSVCPDAPVTKSAFHPHVAIAYANLDVPAAEAIAAVEEANASAEPVSVTITKAALVLLERRQHSYAWEAISRIPLTGHAPAVSDGLTSRLRSGIGAVQSFR